MTEITVMATLAQSNRGTMQRQTRFQRVARALIHVATIIVAGTWAAHALRAQPPGLRPTNDARSPQAVRSIVGALAQTSAVVEGTVESVEYEYSEQDGPRIVTTLTDVTAHLGRVPNQQIKIRQFGGPRPNGRFAAMSSAMAFAKGERYVVFLRNTSWRWTPVVADYAFRVAAADGKEVLVDSVGSVVTSVSDAGVARSSAPVFEAMPTAAVANIDKAVLGLRQQRGSVRDALDVRSFVAQVRAHAQSKRVDPAGDYFDLPRLSELGPNQGWSSPPPGIPAPVDTKASLTFADESIPETVSVEILNKFPSLGRSEGGVE